MNDLHEMSARARNAFYTLSSASLDLRNRALLKLADLLIAEKDDLQCQTRYRSV